MSFYTRVPCQEQLRSHGGFPAPHTLSLVWDSGIHVPDDGLLRVVGQFEPYEGGWGRGFASPQNSQSLGAHFVPFGSEPQGRRRPQPPGLKLTHYLITPHLVLAFGDRYNEEK
jgi:hypothetical protein